MISDKIYLLRRLRDQALDVIQLNAPWEEKYNMIFSKDISKRVHRIDPGFDYYDPDTTYEEDACAFVRALGDRIAELESWVKNV